MQNKDEQNFTGSNLGEQRIIDLFHNNEFLERLEKINTEKEILEIFQENDVYITSEKLEDLHNICEKYITDGMEVVDEEKFLENVAAGITENENRSSQMMKKTLEIIENNTEINKSENKKKI